MVQTLVPSHNFISAMITAVGTSTIFVTKATIIRLMRCLLSIVPDSCRADCKLYNLIDKDCWQFTSNTHDWCWGFTRQVANLRWVWEKELGQKNTIQLYFKFSNIIGDTALSPDSQLQTLAECNQEVTTLRNEIQTLQQQISAIDEERHSLLMDKRIYNVAWQNWTADI